MRFGVEALLAAANGAVSPITDFFNGFELDSTFIGGPTWWEDYLGSLVKAPYGTIFIEGGELSYDFADGAYLGPEKVTNGNFSAGATGWTVNVSGGTVDFSSGAAVFSGVTGNGIFQAITSNVGKYRIAIDASGTSGGSSSLRLTLETVLTISTDGTHTVDFDSSTPNPTLRLYRLSGTVNATFDNISVKEIIPVWLPHDTPSYMIPLSDGTTKAKYPSTYRGYLNEPARTNIYFPSAAPVTKNVTTTAQSYAVSCKGSGSLTLSGTMTGTVTEGSPVIATATAGTLTVTVTGTLTHVQIEAGAFVTSQIDTTTAAVTRPASNLTRPTADVLPSNNFFIWGRVYLAASQSGVVLLGTYTDASNYLQIWRESATVVNVRKRKAGTNYAPATGITIGGGAGWIEYIIFQSDTDGLGISVKDGAGAWSAWAELTDANGKASAVISSTYQIGAINNTTHHAGNNPFVMISEGGKSVAESTRVTYAT